MRDKRQQRLEALAARRMLPASRREDYSAKICETLLTLPELAAAGTVLSYRATAEEADLSLLHGVLRERGLRLAFPVCGKAGAMEAYVPGGWRQGAYGIWEPEPENSALVPPEEIDLVLTPCVAFDEGCMRLGHGAGYYDRYLARCPRAIPLAAAFEAQKVARVLCEEHDRGMDAVVTEAAVYRKR